MKCKKCGNEINGDERRCPICNTYIIINKCPLSNETLQLLIGETDTMHYMLSLTYYQDNPNSFRPVWNTSALIFGPFWLAYRKMYLASLISIGLIYILDTLFPFNIGKYIVAFILFMHGDKIYYEHIKRKYQKIKSNILVESDLNENLKKYGGTNKLVIVFGSVIVGYFVVYSPIHEMNKIIKNYYDSMF